MGGLSYSKTDAAFHSCLYSLGYTLAMGFRYLETAVDFRVYFGEENPQLIAYETLEDTYTKTDNILFVLQPENINVFTREALARANLSGVEGTIKMLKVGGQLIKLEHFLKCTLALLNIPMNVFIGPGSQKTRIGAHDRCERGTTSVLLVCHRRMSEKIVMIKLCRKPWFSFFRIVLLEFMVSTST